ncbi:MAG: MerR family transcriptional regulator [Coriobacteriia bacterium]|nr:MerR family transcriptional regulator [Coriobacteriia bacterium]
MGHTVGEIAALAGISVRTLHHYDEIGLLTASERSDAGYRLYGEADVDRLQQILFFRELGFALEDIRRIMTDPTFDRLEALLLQRRMLTDKAQQLRAMIDAVDTTIDGMEKGIRMSDEEMLEVFDGFDPKEYEDEVRERWGSTDAYKESARRTARYTKDDWARFKAESEEINLAIVALMDAGVAADDPRAMDAVDRHRLQIDHWFYPCSHEMHVGLAEMYIADPRFTATYEKIHEGMARYVHDAILANAARSK